MNALKLEKRLLEHVINNIIYIYMTYTIIKYVIAYNSNVNIIYTEAIIKYLVSCIYYLYIQCNILITETTTWNLPCPVQFRGHGVIQSALA